jgi:pyruvate,water dikinase
MSEQTKPIDRLLYDLRERAKELNCLYEVQELLSTAGITTDKICQGIIEVIPPGWQYPDVCQAEIVYYGQRYQSEGFKESPWVMDARIVVQDEVAGKISVYYTEERPSSDEGPFLKEERKLINTIAEQLGFYFLHEQLKQVFQEQLKFEDEWLVILDLLKRTDPDLLMRLTRKMINYLGLSGIIEVEKILEQSNLSYGKNNTLQNNYPDTNLFGGTLLHVSDQIFAIASKHLSRDEILDHIQKWSREDRFSFLFNVLINPGSSLAEISTAIERYHLLVKQGVELTESREKWFRVALIRRILSDQPHFMNLAQHYIEIDDFNEYLQKNIYSINSYGKLGGKSSGLFLATQILRKLSLDNALLADIKTPKTWYLTSDSVHYFMSFNDLEDLVEQKYRDLNQIRQEYPFIIHVFRNSPLPPEIIKGLSMALDDFGDVPLIVRSSSLLEDQVGASFAGKYKSLFIANKGTKEERLTALMEAVKEVFASMFGPDPIEYRIEHGLIDYHEAMGILIQEVVGNQVGKYYLPAFAGVAFSNNEYRWSSRIKHEDGLVRLVPGLGTRAVDRVSDDYPVLIAPGQPNLRANTTPDEIFRYSPKKVDLINLEERTFETIDIYTLLKETGSELPLCKEIISRMDQGKVQPQGSFLESFEMDNFVVTFDGLLSNSSFLEQLRAIMKVLQEALGNPIDIEFAHDGKDFYLLQCRSQSRSTESIPGDIPRTISPEKILFTANRYISNGMISDISYVVYVDPQSYAELELHKDYIAVGRAIGKLNKKLPRRCFILMGPGRWGSRGDIQLGVSVTYSDINNSAMLIEIAQKQKEYMPEPSFGTHFFQDLVEASIRYLPLYPNDPDIIFNEEFFHTRKNLLPELVPEFSQLTDVIKVICIPEEANGQLLQISMNAELAQAIAILTEPPDKNLSI